jgi:hypothetical protein
MASAAQTEASRRHAQESTAEEAGLKPVGAMVETLTHSIADTHWRIRRASSIENSLFANEACHEENRAAERNQDYNEVDRALAHVRGFTCDPKRFLLLTTCEMRHHRKAASDLKQLCQLQHARRAQRKPKRAKPVNGFVFSAKVAQASACDPQPFDTPIPPVPNPAESDRCSSAFIGG